MNKDLVTTIFGAVAAVMAALQTFNAPAGTSKWLIAAGMIGAGATALWAYWTNKR
ncbi:MAG: hypothetical protein HY323_09255 [Betaproteobacteria bacterium]|nr:hypothetical protein [Betaproteobacteria bacterium]